MTLKKTPKQPTTKKPPEPKTPANNAEPGVICHVGPGCPVCDPAGRPPLTFTGYNSETSAGELPEPRITMETIGPVADVFHASGYFGDLTPAQLAVHIIAGRSLGLDDAQSVFDLEIKPGPVISYKKAQTYQETADAIDQVKADIYQAANKTMEKADGGAATPEKALPADNAKPGVVVDGNFARNADAIETADAIAQMAAKGEIEPVEPLRERENVDSYQKSSNLANNGPVLNSTDEPSLGRAPGPDLTSAAPNLASAGPISDEPQPTITTVPDRDCPPTPPELERWRGELEKMSRELNLDVGRIMTEYDGLDVEAKRQKVDSAWSYYESKTSLIRNTVREALAADGKASLDSQAGFYMFAGVPGNPDNWTYSEAKKAELALIEFFKRPTAPAA